MLLESPKNPQGELLSPVFVGDIGTAGTLGFDDVGTCNFIEVDSFSEPSFVFCIVFFLFAPTPSELFAAVCFVSVLLFGGGSWRFLDGFDSKRDGDLILILGMELALVLDAVTLADLESEVEVEVEVEPEVETKAGAGVRAGAGAGARVEAEGSCSFLRGVEDSADFDGPNAVKKIID